MNSWRSSTLANGWPCYRIDNLAAPNAIPLTQICQEAPADSILALLAGDAGTRRKFCHAVLGLLSCLQLPVDPFGASLPQLISFGIASIASAVAEELLKSHQSTGGATVNLSLGNLSGEKMHAVGIAPERSISYRLCPTRLQVCEFIFSNFGLLTQSNRAVGSWFDTQENVHILDVVACVRSLELALELGQKFRQSSVFDLSHGIEVPCWPSFSNRIQGQED